MAEDDVDGFVPDRRHIALADAIARGHRGLGCRIERRRACRRFDVLVHYYSSNCPGITAGALHRAVQKWIGQSLLADRRSRSMTADEADVVAQRQQFFGDRADELFMTALRHVGASHRALEQ